MKIEMYIINSDNTWSTDWIEIPDETEEEDIKKTAEEKMLERLEKNNIIVDGVAVRYIKK